ncbi:hypothetical protein ACFV4E_29160 [Streptomyces hygroscopicus]|uniref:hypothetical protein n=1 Tax=Streptomyces hygroscopicus TaxID=1912 RepID=UPI001180C596|nr:hypothetical protein [Streptomyces hygroscopicus]
MLNFKGFGHGLPTDGDRDGPSPDRRRPGRNGRVKVVPVQVVRGDEPRAWTDIHAAIVNLLAGPPRPIDVAAVSPQLAPLARTATRLHPRPGAPTWHDSSIGGPLLWPAEEPWPH